MKALVIGFSARDRTSSSRHSSRTRSQVQIKTTKIAGNFYTLEGQGGTIGVLAGPDGVLMVDAQFAPLSDKIVAAIKQISDGRIRFLINTHVHGDHTGGNENIAQDRRDDPRAREPARAAGEAGAAARTASRRAGAAARRCRCVTYDSPLTIRMNGEDVQLIPVPVAHTDGDTMVYFPNANVIMTGDFYRSTGYPNIDRANGGTMNGMLAGFDRDREARHAPTRRSFPGTAPSSTKSGRRRAQGDDGGGARQGGRAGAGRTRRRKKSSRRSRRRSSTRRSPARRRRRRIASSASCIRS